MIVNVFGEYFNPSNITYMDEDMNDGDTDINFVGDDIVTIEGKNRKEVADEINRQLGLLKDSCPF
jgi:hypothetical protein